MKRSVLRRLGLASAALSLGLAGCGSAGIETGVANDPSQKATPLDPSILNMQGRMGPAAAKKADNQAREAAAKGQAPAETEKK